MASASHTAWQQVDSSMFTHVAYNPEFFVLSVIFKSTGKTRSYQQVPPDIFEEMMAAESVGRFYNDNIKGKFTHIDEEPTDAPVQAKTEEVEHGANEAREDSGSDGDVGGITEQAAKGDIVGGSGSDATPEIDQRSGDSEGFEPKHSCAPGEVLADCFVHMEAMPHWNNNGTLVCSECHPNPATKPKETSITLAPQVLPALEAPTTVQEAVKLLSEQSGLIAATIDKSVEVSKQVMGMMVTDAASYQTAGETMKTLATMKDRATKFIDPIRALLLKPYQSAQEKLKAAVSPLETASKHLSIQRNAWFDEQERIRRAEEDRLRKEAEERERQRKAEEDQQLTLSAIDGALESGNEAAAEELLQRPIETPAQYVPPPRVESTVPTESGISQRANWRGEVVDFQALVLAIAEGILDEIQGRGRGAHPPITLLKPNDTAINQLCKAQREATMIPGVRAYKETVESVRRKR